MRVAILGGTGKLGRAFAARLRARGEEAAIGSRDAERARQSAAGFNGHVKGLSNRDAADWCDIAVLTIPYEGHSALVQSLKPGLRGKIVFDTTVPIDPANMLRIRTDTGRSAAEEAAAILDESCVYAAFQTISHRVLRQPEVSHDILVAGEPSRKSEVLQWIRSINLRPIDSGGLEVAGLLEQITILLLSINRQNGVKESSLSIAGV